MRQTFASLLITQQMPIFVGLMSRTTSSIRDLGLPDIRVMDAQVQIIDLYTTYTGATTFAPHERREHPIEK
jgi:hypothetical protein